MICTDIHQFAKELWHINRSIIGVRETLDLIKCHLQNLKLILVPKRTSVFDWKRIEEVVLYNDLITSFGRHCHLLNMKKLFSFWSKKMRENHFYFIDNKLLLWVESNFQKLGRNFKHEDFKRHI